MRLFFLSLLLLTFTVFCHATTITVPDDFATIQEGIDAATAGDTISVKVGTYNEKLTIDKPLVLIGQAMNCTFIQGNDTGTVVSVTSSHVEIKKFTISGSGDFHDEDQPWDAAVSLVEVDSCVVESCRLINNGGAGIEMAETSNALIRYNQITSNHCGIYLYESLHMPNIENFQNHILHNQITSNGSNGIRFTHTLAAHHHSNVVAFNMISNNSFTGLSMIMCSENNIMFNQLSFNSHCFGFIRCMGGGDENVFHNNVFESPDETTARFYYEADMGFNHFNQTVGNYWADYSGSDGNGDGIGDDPVEIGYGAYDWAPLMSYDDTDGDGITDSVDNCPLTANSNQSDMNGNGVGDLCDDFVCGDANGDKLINVGDAVSLINYIFRQGPSPQPEMAGDNNCDEDCNIGDAVYLINHIFNGGPEPCCP